MNRLMKPTALALGLALAGAAFAQATPTPAQQKELDAARAALDAAAQRYGELASRYGQAGAPIRIERRVLRKPVIGVLLAPDDAAGVRIAGVTPDSAAASGGLRSGDRITRIDGKPLKAATAPGRVEEARALLATLDAKTAVTLGYERDGKAGEVMLTPKVGDRLMVLPEGAMFDGDVQVVAGDDGRIEVLATRAGADAGAAAPQVRIAAGDARRHAEWSAAVAPEVRTEIIRLGNDCKGERCELPVLAEAFRWNGLNLAAVDPQLGRYFGASAGVLVLSTGQDLAGLQAGDVIQRIAGKPVASPREAMEALRAQPAESKVAVEYLRDRKQGTAQVSVPKALPFAMPRVAIAPHAPGMPGAAGHRTMVIVDSDGKAASGLAPKDGTRVEKRRYVMVDKDGKRTEWEGDAGATPPAWVQALPNDGTRVEKRMQVIVDDNGKTTVIEEDGPPPPAPPAPPAPPKGG